MADNTNPTDNNDSRSYSPVRQDQQQQQRRDRSRSPVHNELTNDNDTNNNNTSVDGSQSPDLDDQGVYRKRLMCTNVPQNYNIDDMVSLFSQYGTIVNIELPKQHINKYTGQPSSRWGFVSFLHADQAQKAASELHDRLINGRKFYVTRAKPKGVKSDIHSNKQQQQPYNSSRIHAQQQRHHPYAQQQPRYRQSYRQQQPYYDPYYNQSHQQYNTRQPYQQQPQQHQPRRPVYDYDLQSQQHQPAPYVDPYQYTAATPYSNTISPLPSTTHQPQQQHTNKPYDRNTVNSTMPSVPSERGEMQLFISNIGLQTTFDEVMSVLSQYGNIMQHKILHSKINPQSIGSLFVSYETEQQASIAQQSLNNVDILGARKPRGLICEWSGRFAQRNHFNPQQHQQPYTEQYSNGYDQHQQYYDYNQQYSQNTYNTTATTQQPYTATTSYQPK